jgi:hypothetical protein
MREEPIVAYGTNTMLGKASMIGVQTLFVVYVHIWLHTYHAKGRSIYQIPPGQNLFGEQILFEVFEQGVCGRWVRYPSDYEM